MQRYVFLILALASILLTEVNSLTNINQEWKIEPAGQTAEGPIVKIRSSRSNKCIDNKERSKVNGNHIQQNYCFNDDGQKWVQIFKNDNDHFILKNVGSGKCIQVPGGSKEEGLLIQQWTCYGTSNMQWKYENRRIISRVSGKCLTVTNGGTANNVILSQATCN